LNRPRPQLPDGMSTTADAVQTPAFSLELSQDQRDIRDWLHGFAAGVLRPAAHEWVLNGQKAWATNGGIAKMKIA